MQEEEEDSGKQEEKIQQGKEKERRASVVLKYIVKFVRAGKIPAR